MSQKDYTAILVRSMDKNDTDKWIKLLTAKYGIMTCLLKGVKKHTAKLKTASMPFACGIYSITDKGNVVTGFVSLHEFDWLVKDYGVYVVASLGLEIVEQACVGGDSTLAMQLLLGFFKSLLSVEPQIALKEYAIGILQYLGYKKDYTKWSAIQLVSEIEYRVECQFLSKKLVFA